MPHLVLEYSANLEETVDIADLIKHLHEVGLETGVFPLGGIRTRAERRDIYRIADGDPRNRFANLTARVGFGRSLEVRQKAGEHIFAAFCEYLAEAQEEFPLSISFEIQEMHEVLNFKKNNIHKILEQKNS